LRYLLADGLGFALGAGFRLGVGKSLKMPQNPASQVHAVFGGLFIANFSFSEACLQFF